MRVCDMKIRNTQSAPGHGDLQLPSAGDICSQTSSTACSNERKIGWPACAVVNMEMPLQLPGRHV